MEEIRVLLVLLDKAEQILSFLNLPQTTIKKYNELKQLTCNKLNLEFIPISNLSQKPQDSASENLPYVGIINELKKLSTKKTCIIESLLELIDASYFDTTKVLIAQNFSDLLTRQISEANRRSFQRPNPQEFEFEMRLEEIKLKEFVGRAETNARKLVLQVKEKQVYSSNSQLNARHSYNRVLVN